jgi:acetolactate synthase I/II/III large subunit
MQGLNAILESSGLHHKLDFSSWRVELDEQKKVYPPQYAIQVLDELTKGEAIISTGVGQRQMWTAWYYNYKRPRQGLSSSGSGAMCFVLPAAAGAAFENPHVTVVDIDGDGSFLMNIQKLAKVENQPVKTMVLND